MNPKLTLEFDRSLRLPAGQWFAEEHVKRQIYLHHTVGGSAKSTYNWWVQDPGRIGTAYIIERDGTIFEVFPPEHWAHHIGKGSLERHNQQSIGIEMASEGALTMGKDNKLYCFDGKKEFTGTSEDLVAPWRGYRYFDSYEEVQTISVCWLVRWLCEQFSIPKHLIPFEDKNAYRPELRDSFQGVLGHCNVRQDKTDPNPSFNWKLLQRILQEEERMNNKTHLPTYRCSEHVDDDLPDGAEVALASGFTAEGKFVGDGHECEHEACVRVAKYYLREKPVR